MHSSKRRRGGEKQGAGGSSSRVEDCSLLTPLSGVVTDWCEDDEDIPTNVTVAAAIAAIAPRQVFARQRVRATRAPEAAEEQSTKRSKNEEGVRDSAHSSPEYQAGGKGGETPEPRLAPGPVGGSENTNSTQSLADAEVSGLSDGKTDATDQEAPLTTSASLLTQHLPSAHQNIAAVHAMSSSGIDFSDGLVLIVEKSARSRRSGSIDDDDDDPEDEDYVDDGKGADGEDGDGDDDDADDDDADDDDDEEGGRQDADEEDHRHLATLRDELGENHHSESAPVKGPIVISLLDSPVRKQAR